MKLKVSFNNKAGVDRSITDLIKICCFAVLKQEKSEEFGNAEVSVLLTGSGEIKILNRDYRGKDKSTDTLSFPINEINPENNFTMLGDIVINVELARKQAFEYGHSSKREIAFLAVHSMLHLLGYDHENCKSDEEIMREKQTRILNELGICVEIRTEEKN
ncbi:MAG: rRNA maturation RNase YbeY [Oscillospiraceae bacterium]|nr:rRNA maturation RNase YbeY [Oscillospiraceae bacterium]